LLNSRPTCASLVAPCPRRPASLVVSVCLLLFASVVLHPTPVRAGTAADQEGDNKSEADIEGESEGGDAIAGSQVISVTGAARSEIRATNTSRFATAKGGDAKGSVNVNVRVGPTVTNSEPTGRVSADARGDAGISQSATPIIGVTLDQFAFPTGEAYLSGSAIATNTLTGTNVVSGGSSGVGDMNQTITQTNASPITSDVFVPLNVTGSNTAGIAGMASISQLATTNAAPKAIAVGGSSTAANAVGDAQVTQDAAPDVTVSVAPSSSPRGRASVTSELASNGELGAANTVTGATTGPVDQSITQTNNSPITSTVAPAVNVTGVNSAAVALTSPVTQEADTLASPMAIATAGSGVSEGKTSQHGSNFENVDVSVGQVGGDAVAGSNVIGVVGAGASIVIASNSSEYARARGGDTKTSIQVSASSGPVFRVTGAANESQTAALAPPAEGDHNVEVFNNAAAPTIAAAGAVNPAGVPLIEQPLIATFGVARPDPMIGNARRELLISPTGPR
jgi:hypothetical protein